MTTQPPATTAISVWGDRNEVRELKARLAQMAVMLPGGARLDANAITALAQASIAHGLDPFNGEIWIIPGSGVMIGIKGLRKKAREQVQGNYWIDFHQITSPEEKVALGIPASALAYEARLFDTENVNTYTSTVERMLKAGLPWEAVERMVGTKPYTVGIGFAKPDERSKMELAQRALKRAEADAIKRRFDVPFGLAVEVEGDAPVFEGEWVETAATSANPVTAAGQEATGTALYGDEAPAGEHVIEQATPVAPDAPPIIAATPPTPQRPAAGTPTPAAVMKVRESSNVKAWRAWAEAFVKRFPEYQTTLKGGAASGQPNFHHILGAAKKCLYDAVTDDNVADVMRAVEARAAENAVPA